MNEEDLSKQRIIYILKVLGFGKYDIHDEIITIRKSIDVRMFVSIKRILEPYKMYIKDIKVKSY